MSEETKSRGGGILLLSAIVIGAMMFSGSDGGDVHNAPDPAGSLIDRIIASCQAADFSSEQWDEVGVATLEAQEARNV